MNKAYLLIGGNIGDVRSCLQQARAAIEIQIGRIVRFSGLYQTASWGIEDQPDFLNQVLYVETYLTAEQALDQMLSIESQMGRVRKEKNGSRIIDIDLLFFNDIVIELPRLKVPHPLLHIRNFTLFPLAEIAGDYLHPVLHQSINELLAKSPDTLEVKKLTE